MVDLGEYIIDALARHIVMRLQQKMELREPCACSNPNCACDARIEAYTRVVDITKGQIACFLAREDVVVRPAGG